jgi:uncharacterized membrane protein YphA (DoxX/SURF4 family)
MWNALLVVAFLGFWFSCIWTSGNDPLSTRLGYTAAALFMVMAVSLICTIPLILVLDAKEQSRA